jgi:hypothetical protein
MMPVCFQASNQQDRLINKNHHGDGVRNPHQSLQETDTNQSLPVAIAILSNTSPLTFAAGFGLRSGVFEAQHATTH